MINSRAIYNVLIDSDAFVGQFYPSDAHFQRASDIFAALEEQGSAVATTSMVVAEVATVLSHRQGQALARTFLQKIERSRIPVIHIDEALQEHAAQLFMAQDKKGTSFTDCTNVVVARQLNIPLIFSFDGFYKRLGLPTIQVNKGGEKAA